MIRFVMLVLIAGFLVSVPQPLLAETKDLKAELESAIATMNKAIQEKNDPMRNRMFFKFRLIEQDNPKTVAPYLIKNLESEIPGVPEYTAFTLGWIADKEAIPVLRKLLLQSDSLKRAALQALGNMEAHDALNDMVQLLSDPQERVRQDAAYSLGLLGNEKAIPELRKALEDKDELVRWFANEAIERIENRKKYGW